jgi:hypothetical protein
VNRITQRDLDGMMSRLYHNMRTNGIIATGEVIMLQPGSKYYGNSYQVWTRINSERARQPFGTFHFGFTARECYDRMHAMCVALETKGQAA